jgi:hypothetical protein
VDLNDQSGRGRPVRWDAVLAAIAVVVAIGYFGPMLFSKPSAGPDVITGTGGDPYPTHALASGPAATTTATAAASGPFAHTPAATWPEGEAGITLPAATDVEGFTAAEVQSALDQVRTIMVSTRLDRRMLVNHDVTGFLDLVAPAVRSGLETLINTVSMNRLMVVTLVQDGARLSSLPPRVSGRTSFAPATDQGRAVLQVVTNYVWAYAFDGDAVVVVHDELRWNFLPTAEVRDTTRGPWPGGIAGYLVGMDCAAAEHGFLAPPSSPGVRTSVAPTERPGSLYEPDHSLAITDTCPA